MYIYIYICICIYIYMHMYIYISMYNTTNESTLLPRQLEDFASKPASPRGPDPASRPGREGGRAPGRGGGRDDAGNSDSTRQVELVPPGHGPTDFEATSSQKTPHVDLGTFEPPVSLSPGSLEEGRDSGCDERRDEGRAEGRDDAGNSDSAQGHNLKTSPAPPSTLSATSSFAEGPYTLHPIPYTLHTLRTLRSTHPIHLTPYTLQDQRC